MRPIGSPPSVFVDTVENAQQFRQDNIHDRCRVELFDGRCFTMHIHLFSASELRGYFSGNFEIETLRGLDLFHSRFALDPRWNPPVPALADDQFDSELSRIEEAYAASPRFIEHAAHLLARRTPPRHACAGSTMNRRLAVTIFGALSGLKKAYAAAVGKLTHPISTMGDRVGGGRSRAAAYPQVIVGFAWVGSMGDPAKGCLLHIQNEH